VDSLCIDTTISVNERLAFPTVKCFADRVRLPAVGPIRHWRTRRMLPPAEDFQGRGDQQGPASQQEFARPYARNDWNVPWAVRELES